MLGSEARKAVLAIVVLVLSALPAVAYRAEFVAQSHGTRVAGAEVCFFPAGADEDDPFDFFLHADQARCLSADQVIDIPAGRWLYYLKQTKRGLISSNPSLIKYRGSAAAPDIYGTNVVDMEPAATLDLSEASGNLGVEETFAVYESNRDTNLLPMIIPISRGQTSALVPASMPLILIRRQSRQIRAVSDPMTLREGEIRHVRSTAGKTPDGATLIAWTIFPADARTPKAPWERVPAPAILAIADGNMRSPAVAPRPGFGADGALAIFRGLPAGRVTVTAGGGAWTRDELALDVQGEGVIVAPRALVIKPAAALRVRWTVQGQTPHPQADCGGIATASAPAPASITLFTCEGLQPGMTPDLVDPHQCAVAAKPAVIDRATRTASFEGVAPGTYVLVVNEPPFPPARNTVAIGVGETPTIDATLQAFRVFGKVVLDGEAVQAQIEFATGRAVSDSAGQYDAALRSDPRDLPIHVRPCSNPDIVRTHIPDKPLVRNAPYDLVFAQNDVTVAVVDRASRAPIPEAVVTLGVLHEGSDDAGDFLAETPSADAEGMVIVRDVPAARRLVACAEAKQFRRACTPAFTIEGDRHKRLTVELERSDRYRGIVAGQPFSWGRVFFVSPTGAVTEASTLEHDGSFTFGRSHVAPEYAVVVSDQPLFVVDLGRDSPAVLNVAAPRGAARDLQVTIDKRGKQQDALIGLLVDGHYIPDPALSLHQGGRNLQPNLYGGGPLVIPAIVAAQSVEVMLGPSPSDPMIDTLHGADVFTIPAYRATFPVRSVDAAGRVSF